MRPVIVGGVMTMLLVASSAWSDPIEPAFDLFSTRPIHDPWRIAWPAVAFPSTPLQRDDAQPLHPAAVEHSDGYQLRKKIHKVASFATLPLFATEVALGQSLYTNSANVGSRRAAHAFVGASIVGSSASTRSPAHGTCSGKTVRTPKAARCDGCTGC
jgi:hypothetical protein